MSDFIDVGKIVNTFGIKGELKVKSFFELKDKVFKEGFNIYIGELKEKEVIDAHRIHKNYDLITLKNYSNINEVLKYKGNVIYILRSDLKLNNNEYLLKDLIGFSVYDENKLLGVVIDYEENINNILLKIKGEKSFYLPLIDEYIVEVLVKEKKILTNKGSELVI